MVCKMDFAGNLRDVHRMRDKQFLCLLNPLDIAIELILKGNQFGILMNIAAPFHDHAFTKSSSGMLLIIEHGKCIEG